MGQLQDASYLLAGQIQDSNLGARQKKFDLKKHVATIHSANQLSLIQRKIANALLFNAYEDLLTKVEYSIHIRDLCQLIGYNSHEQKSIKRALVSLISTVIEWNLVDKDKLEHEEWNASAIIADASIKGPICTYSYSNRMRQLLHSPEIYGRINMKVQAKFKSSYGLALYENCIRYQTIKTTPWFDLCVFKKLMGVEPQKYAVFKDFRKRVIDVAVTEVNKHTYYDVAYDLKKMGRKVVAIKFHVGTKNTELSETKKLATETDDLYQRLVAQFEFQPAQARAVLNEYPDAYILSKLSLILSSSSYRQGKIKNKCQYVLAALEENYQTTTNTASVPKNFVVKPKDIPAQSPEPALAPCLQQFYALATVEQQAIEQQFVEEIRGSIYDTLYQKDGLENTVVKQRFVTFLLNQ